ncbi:MULTISPECIES: type IV toxin-antitoxin system AbiEi family antitoxin domain-containing protein [Rhizobium]|uniref:Putative transcriptional regulator of viral defense system n=1 Tax=Rhizobium paranaense TaxID=1650438 RepID=A0A7W8XSA0_9HYPH|nr:type IV toxin-antitoxin system AbiEi family antitoxin [Rhizobium paranaense]MBB5574660.1 putative transcriptional regulator of viral defense system [Rhizobium paranaense]
MSLLDDYIERKLINGFSTFTREEVLAELPLKPDALTAALTRQISRKRLANPKHGFYVILRPEDKITGAPDPARWIDPLMRYLGLDYRISLLRAAAMHGSSHQAAMVFQVVVPQQFRSIVIGRHRVQFIYLAPAIFSATNQKEWLASLKTDTGYAQAAGVELTLLDCIRYFKRATGINGVAQIAKDIGDRANPKKLASIAQHFENTSIRRLGYLLDMSDHRRQANALQPFARQTDKYTPLDPSVRPLIEGLSISGTRDDRWRLDINETVEIDF